MTRAKFLHLARQWVGTVYHHGQAVKGLGCDCGGLVFGVAKEAGFVPKDAAYENVPRAIPDNYLRQTLRRYGMRSVPYYDRKPADVLVLEVLGREQHLGICCGETFLHVMMDGRVVETPLDDRWLGRIRSVYRFRQFRETD